MPAQVFVLCDMEGVSLGTSLDEELSPSAPRYQDARRWLTGDLKAVVEGAMAAGAESFVIYDMHYYGTNVIADELPDCCNVISGKPYDTGLREGMAALFMVGLHAMVGNQRGVLPHTYNHEIRLMELNGMPIGEVGLEAAAAGAKGVPLTLVVGDFEGGAEACQLLPTCQMVAVKWLDETRDILLRDTAETRSAIREAAATAFRLAAHAEPLAIDGPCVLRIVCSSASFRDRMRKICGGKAQGDLELLIKGPDLWSVYAAFRKSQTAT